MIGGKYKQSKLIHNKRRKEVRKAGRKEENYMREAKIRGK